MKKIYLIIIIISTITSAQTEYINQVLLLNEGCYDYSEQIILDPPKVGSYDPLLNEYNTVVEIADARFASDLMIDEGFFYVAADNKLLKYDLNTYEMVASESIPGIRKILIHNDYIFVSKGDYDPNTFGPVVFDSYLDIYTKSDLSFFLSFDSSTGPMWSTENLLKKDNILYVAINNGYEWGNEKGILGLVDLESLLYVNEIDLGENGRNPVNLLMRDNQIFTINNNSFDGSSISKIDIINLDVESVNLENVNTGCGASVVRGDDIYYQISSEDAVYKFNTSSLSQEGIVNNLDYNYYAFSKDNINNLLYASISNFISSSGIVIYNEDNEIVNTFFADVATSKIIFDVRLNNNTSIDDSSTEPIIINSVDLLGRQNSKKQGFKINIYNNETIQKTFLIKK
tara:strand:+ start:970 stop:2169 length:1200 start_codon:yes stop_codon:yes gene_type:complete